MIGRVALARRRRARWRAAARARLPWVSRLARVARAMRAAMLPTERARRRLERSGRGDLLQPAVITWADRHPALFDAVCRHLASKHRPSLLSFGCATGEEAFTLARYLPDAQIDAVDINPACISSARRAAWGRPGTTITFACASAPDPAKAAFYDAVFCLSVLRHGRLDAEMPDSCEGIMRFERFAAVVDLLDRAVRPGGLLVLWGCHFRFADTMPARRYRPLRVADIHPQPPPFYGPDNCRLDVPFYGDFVFEKQ